MATENKIAELQEQGFCVLKQLFPATWIHACRKAFWPLLLDYLKHNSEKPNRGPHRHFMPMPFEPPCFRPELFFDESILSIVQGVMGEEIVADQWVCDTPVLGSENQNPHVDYQRPLFSENPDLALPTYMLVVSFGLVDITPDNGPLEIAPGTHQMRRKEAMQAVQSGAIGMRPVLLEIGDVLVRHPWTLHRGTPNTMETPRALATIRYVRKWYADSSRDVNPIPWNVWRSLTSEQQAILRFPIGNLETSKIECSSARSRTSVTLGRL